MKFSLNNKKQIFLSLLLILSLNIIKAFKPDSKKSQGGITNTDVKKNPHYKKDCEVKEKCRECSFEELKNYFECQITGYKIIKHCRYYDETKLMDEEFYNEPCLENRKLNSVYVFLIICFVLGGLSFYIRKAHRSMILSQTLEKLTILRKKA
jgi:hypothetical protein